MKILVNKKIMLHNKVFLLLLFFLGVSLNVHAFELDLSVDEEIKRKYNSSKLEYEVLPSLPSATPSKVQAKTVTPTYSKAPEIVSIEDKDNAKKISSRTKFKVRSNQAISDWSKEGSTVSFTTSETVYKKYVTIPSGTKIYAKIVDSHGPQFTGNGGLVEIEITGLTYNGKTYEAYGKVIKVNSKKVFLNNIKGKRKYWANVVKHVNDGENFYKKTRDVSSKMAENPILIILSPIPTVVGIVGCSVRTVLSPVTALATKGGSVSIPSGSDFEIKLLDPVYVK